VLERVGDFMAFLDEAFDEAFTYAALRKAENIGRAIGSPQWLEDMEAKTGIALKPKKRGPMTKFWGLSKLSP
jgi:putative transposase